MAAVMSTPLPAERAMVRLLDAARPYTTACHHAPFHLNLSYSVPEAIQVTLLATLMISGRRYWWGKGPS